MDKTPINTITQWANEPPGGYHANMLHSDERKASVVCKAWTTVTA